MSAKIIMHDLRGDYTIYEFATLSQRFFASMIDVYMFGVIYSIFSMAFNIYFSKFIPLVYLDYVNFFLGFIAGPIYVIYPMCKTGQTLGKKIMNLKVVYKDRPDELSFGAVFLREIIGKYFGLIFFFGYILVIFSADRRGFHDLIAKTKVVVIRND